MTIFIIGASGYIGKRLHDHLCLSHEVVGTGNSGHNFVKFSLAYPDGFDFGCVKSGDIVVVAAAISSPDICAREYERAYNINVTGTVAFIKRVMACGAKVIFFSSDTVYGQTVEMADEFSPVYPVGPYGAMKRAVEVEFSGCEAFKAIRLSYVFSFADKFSQYLIACAEKGQVAEVFTPFSRCVVYREDVIEGVVKLVENWSSIDSGIVNFCGPELVAREDFVRAMGEKVLPGLRYSISEPDASFFKNRPRVIEIRADLFSKLLGRRPRSLSEAIVLECGSGDFK